MLEAATACGDRDLVAEAHLLRAAALIELGDPAGRSELLAYTAMAEELGHVRGRWAALTRRATFAQIAGHTDEAARLADEACRLGMAIGIPDAVGCFCSLRWSLVALGGAEVSQAELDGELPMGMDALDPLWPMFPMFDAWAPAVRGDIAAARAALGDFSVLDIPTDQGWRRWPSRPSSSRSPAQRPNGPGPTSGSYPSPAATSSSAAARPTTPRSTITWAHWPPPAATTARRQHTSEPPWPCTNGSVRPDGVDCPRRPWPI